MPTASQINTTQQLLARGAEFRRAADEEARRLRIQRAIQRFAMEHNERVARRQAESLTIRAAVLQSKDVFGNTLTEDVDDA